MSVFRKPETDLVLRLGSKERAAQRAACDEVAHRLKDEPELRQLLRDLLHEGSLHARFAAAFVLFHEDRPTLRLLPALLDALELEDGDLRWSAARMLATLGRLHGEVLPLLLHAARASDSPTRQCMALYTLRELAPENSQTHESFVAALNAADPQVRRAALSSLAKLTDPSRDCLDRALEIASNDEDPSLRRIAVTVLPDLARHHAATRDEVAALLTTLQTASDPALARAARAASGRLGETLH
jgi:HEAT repeat protein